MATKQIKVIIVKPGKKPILTEINNDLKTMQDIVEGHIQMIKPYDDVAFIMNEDGKRIGQKPNRALRDKYTRPKDIIVGPFILCYAPPESEDFLSLPDEYVDKYMQMFAIPEFWVEVLE